MPLDDADSAPATTATMRHMNSTTCPVERENREARIDEVARDLQNSFGVAFSIYDAESGELLLNESAPRGDEGYFSALSMTTVMDRKPQLLYENAGVVAIGIPVRAFQSERWLAIGIFVCERLVNPEALRHTAQALGLSTESTRRWIETQPLWTSDALLRMGSIWLAKWQADMKAQRAVAEVEKVAENLVSTYEEITLLYGLTQNLRISNSDEDTGRFALSNLAECLPAECVTLLLNRVAKSGETTYRARTEPDVISIGKCPLAAAEIPHLIEELELTERSGPFVANRPLTDKDAWPYPAIKQIIAVPVEEGSNIFGWLFAINHNMGGEFNTVEANLMASVGVLLGIHSGNRELYRQQAEFLASVVRALSSAIDAKDPYTCGHSDRVARIAVRLARELQCSDDMLQTIYMAGLLHDIGKIGINESVLRKPGKLTPEEYEHIKQHPELGYRILADIRQLQDVLPAVLHHHEQWDGQGYPHGLAGEQIPRIALIMAVADAYDAMFSSRPYRPGLPEAKVEEMLRNGAGKQWAADVVEAYFRARDDIRAIGNNGRANLSMDVRQWTT